MRVVGTLLLLCVTTLLAGCSSDGGPDTTAGTIPVVLSVRLVVSPNPVPNRPDLEVSLAAISNEADAALPVYTGLLTTKRADFKIDVTRVEALELRFGAEPMLQIDRSSWEGYKTNRFTIVVDQVGVHLTRRGREPEVCAPRGDGGVRCAEPVVIEERFIPIDLAPIDELLVVPVNIRIPTDLREELPAAVIVVEEVDAGGGTSLLLERVAGEGGTGQQTVLSIDRESTIRISLDDDRVVEIGPEIWRLSWTRMIVTLLSDGIEVKRRWPVNGELKETTIQVPYDTGESS